LFSPNYHKWIMFKILIWIVLFLPCFALTKELPPQPAEVLKVIDGDTIDFTVQVWPDITVKTRVRLRGVNTPEKRGKVSDCEKKAAKAATQFTIDWLTEATNIVLTEIKPGKYRGRVLAWVIADQGNLSDALIAAGHGRPYNGGKRKPWCN